MAQTSIFAADLNEKFSEKAEHTLVCEQFSENFSFKSGQRWAFPSRG
jgi:hypothetical protein